jgi:hypothetical protein
MYSTQSANGLGVNDGGTINPAALSGKHPSRYKIKKSFGGLALDVAGLVA